MFGKIVPRCFFCFLTAIMATQISAFEARANEDAVANHALEEKIWSVDISSTFISDYVFRGQNLYDGISIQPSVGVEVDLGSLGSLGASVWSHLSAEGGNGASEKFTEVDYILSHEKSVDIVTLGAGLIWYEFPGEEALKDTAEFYLSASLDTILSPTLIYYHDYDAFDINYWDLTFSQELSCDSMGEEFSVTPALTFGFASNADQIYKDNSGLMHVTLGLSTDLPWGKYFTVTPKVLYNFEVDDTTQNEFYAGFDLTASI